MSVGDKIKVSKPYLAFLEIKRMVFGVKYFAEIDITDNCNLRCKHCYHFHGKKNFQKEFPLKIWKERFEELYSNGIRIVLLVGGEPALRKDVLLLANVMFPIIYVITNGTIFISKEFNHPIFVSLDGMERTNDAIRGEGTFSNIIKNYSGDGRVAINMTLTETNYKELADVIELSRQHGFRGVVCNICASGTDVKIPTSVKRDNREQIIIEMKRVKEKYPGEYLLSKYMIKWYEIADHREKCYWGDEVLHFDVGWKTRRCFGSNTDCSNCGCLSGAFQNPLRLAFSREFNKLVKHRVKKTLSPHGGF